MYVKRCTKLPLTLVQDMAIRGNEEGLELAMYIIENSNPLNHVETKITGTCGYITPMHLAAAFTESAGRMISNSIAPNVPNDKGETPIHLAAMNNQLEMVQLLMASSGNPSSQDNWGLTPIHEAAKRGYLEIVRLLMTATDNPNTQTKYSGEIPIHFAAGNFLTSLQWVCRSIACF